MALQERFTRIQEQIAGERQVHRPLSDDLILDALETLGDMVADIAGHVAGLATAIAQVEEKAVAAQQASAPDSKAGAKK